MAHVTDRVLVDVALTAAANGRRVAMSSDAADPASWWPAEQDAFPKRLPAAASGAEHDSALMGLLAELE